MPSSLRRGFKADAERLAMTIRRQLGIGPRDALDGQVLARHLGIRVLPLTDLRDDVEDPRHVQRLLRPGSGFSALTVGDDLGQLIVFNPAHPPGRQANSLVHELSHIILKHEPAPALGQGGCRRWDEIAESEADWLAGALLVPREGALWWLRSHGGLPEGASHFGVSEALFRWRVNQTGVIRQLQARRARKDALSPEVGRAITDERQRRGVQQSEAPLPNARPVATEPEQRPARDRHERRGLLSH
jgi:Zn-dependent peptidase ImmA (M78 family)